MVAYKHVVISRYDIEVDTPKFFNRTRYISSVN